MAGLTTDSKVDNIKERGYSSTAMVNVDLGGDTFNESSGDTSMSICPEKLGEDNFQDENDDESVTSVGFLHTLAAYLPHNKVQPEALDSFSAAFILINFISIGYILVPHAFAQAGTVLGAICLAFVSLQSSITGVYVLEACTRAEMLKVSMSNMDETSGGARLRLADTSNRDFSHREFTSRGGSSYRELSYRDVSMGAGLDDENPMPTESTPMRRRSSVVNRRYLPRRHSLRIHQRTYEISELSRIFMGRWLRNFFTFTSAGDLYGITWTFAAVFGSSLAEHLPMGTNWDYQVYILIFMAVTVPVSCMRIAVQVPLQLCFLLARTIMLFLMLGTLYGAWASDEPHFGTQSSPARVTPLANFSSILTVLQVCVFSTAFQFSVPGLTAETGNKGSMGKIIRRAVTYIYFSNLILSLLMATYFGYNTQPSSNLNWVDYHGGTWDGSGEFTRAWWATAISSYIVLFAALDGLAVYPLIAISLGDILMGARYEDDVHEIQDNWKIRLSFRLVASIPQAIGSMFVKDLGVIAKYAGIFTVLSYTVCPSYLSIKSRQQVRKAHLPTDTKYKTIFSNDWVAWILIVLALCLVVAVIVDAIVGFSGESSTVHTTTGGSNGANTVENYDIETIDASTIREEAAQELFPQSPWARSSGHLADERMFRNLFKPGN